MKSNHQFSIAVHLLTCLARSEEGMPSGMLAQSVNTSPSFLRRTLSKLSKFGLVQTSVGKSGTCTLKKNANRISMLDIYQAVEAPEVFSVHQYPTQKICPVSCGIKDTLAALRDRAQKAMEESLKKVTLAEITADLRKSK
jgi:Rrf2 family protein